jgi:hypothetical protein
VIPINNFQDEVAPERIENLTLRDRPLDDGSAVNLEFELSSASDIFEYQVYAAPFRFTSVGNGSNGPITPTFVTDRSPNFPLTISQLAGGFDVTPQLTVWVAVVPVDFAGNAIVRDLITASVQSIDDGFANNGNNLPSVEGLVVSWINGDKILIEWEQTESEVIEGYQVHISSENFSDIANATLIGDEISTTSFIVSRENFPSLTNTSDYYLSVTPFDQQNVKQTVEAIQLSASQETGGPAEDKGDLSLQTLLSTRNFLAAGIVIAVLVLLLTFSRSRKGRSDISKAWDTQASTWGTDDGSQMDGLLSPETSLSPMPAGYNQPNQPLQPNYGQSQQMQPVQPQPVQPVYNPAVQQPMQPVQPQPVQPAYNPTVQQPMQPVQPQPVQPAYNPVAQQPNQVQPSAGLDLSFLDELL